MGENNKLIRQSNRPVTVTVRYPNNQEEIVKSGNLKYSSKTGLFSGLVNMGTAGLLNNAPTELIEIKMDTMRGFASTGTILKPETNNIPQITLRAGLDHDNNVDVVTYYNILLDCFNGKKGCKNLQEADINDDGKADGIDYNIFLKSIMFILDRQAEN